MAGIMAEGAKVRSVPMGVNAKPIKPTFWCFFSWRQPSQLQPHSRLRQTYRLDIEIVSQGTMRRTKDIRFVKRKRGAHATLGA
jgi:hypothetical protein